MDLDLRKLRYFAAVADLGHFGRAAEQLYIAQPVLSRQIRALETEMGCDLFLRTTRSVELTAAGRQLRHEASIILGTVDAATRRVLEVDRGIARLVIGFAPGLHVSEAVRQFSDSHPAVEIEMLHLKWWEQDAPLRDGRVHVGFLRRPFDDTGLRVIPIGEEAKVVCLPATHPLALQETVSSQDLVGEPILDALARKTSSVEEKFELVASGHGIALVPVSVARSYQRLDLVYRPWSDGAPVETCLAILGDQRDAGALEFMTIAAESLRETATRPAQ
ncbi:LysR family transcriptional regulator [Glaciihabitans sp. dw_435]|uniref:LysR family transcriptional regulator n=1 Tax=Glaciihabitans sp. dw_435 TaxID=2720081 RepID=UPI001BD5A1E2|nr:LysR substrate-binding domain-containing protein [Glaciihabitans sp. dw_435]